MLSARISYLLGVAIIVTVSGCATNHDPGSANFLQAMDNLDKGVYEKRLEERRKRLELLKNARDDALDEKSLLKGNKLAKEQELAMVSSRVNQLDREIDELQKKTAKLAVSSKSTMDKQVGVQKRLLALRSELERVRRMPKGDDEAVKLYKARERELREDLKRLAGEVELLGR